MSTPVRLCVEPKDASVKADGDLGFGGVCTYDGGVYVMGGHG